MNYQHLANVLASKTGAEFSSLQALKVIQAISSEDIDLVPRSQLEEITKELAEHPEDYEGACLCSECRSYQ